MTLSDAVIIEELVELNESDKPEDAVAYYELLLVASDPVMEALIAYHMKSYIIQ